MIGGDVSLEGGVENDKEGQREVLRMRQVAVLQRIQMLDARLGLGTAARQGSKEENRIPDGDVVDVSGQHLKISGLPENALRRWSHSAVVRWDPETTEKLPKILVFGGYGGPGANSRRNDLLEVDSWRGCGRVVTGETGGVPPSARLGHTANAVGGRMVVVGGREGPETPLGDVHILDLGSFKWQKLEAGGAQFVPRFRHAAAVVSSSLFCFGGLTYDRQPIAALQILDLDTGTWSPIIRPSPDGPQPQPRHSHTLTVLGDQIFLSGGKSEGAVFGGGVLWVLDTRTLTWRKQTLTGHLSLPRFSHSLLPAPIPNHLLLFGGCPAAKQVGSLFLIDPFSGHTRVLRGGIPAGCLPVRHTVTRVGDKLVVLGGGAFCFAFGSVFSPPFELGIRSFLPGGGGDPDDTWRDVGEPGVGGPWAVVVGKFLGKEVKDGLKRRGWLDARWRVESLRGGEEIAFPITDQGAAQVLATEPGGATRVGGAQEIPTSGVSRGAGGADSCHEMVAAPTFLQKHLRNGEARLRQLAVGRGGRACHVSPPQSLKSAVLRLLVQHSMPTALAEEVPTKWERLGDMVILPAGALEGDTWRALGGELWTAVAHALGAQRVARQAPVANTDTRDSQLSLLLGPHSLVSHRENGILFTFDARKCIFSSGNVSEKIRVSRFRCGGETVIDLFAGIGYYTLPVLCLGGAGYVYACEWNPWAISALRRNLEGNGVGGRCCVLEGDNRVTCPNGVGDRVLLGLIPSSEGSWRTAVEGLRIRGGFLHIHGNARDVEEAQWAQRVVDEIGRLAAEVGGWGGWGDGGREWYSWK